MKVFKFIVLALVIFVASFAATFVMRDPAVDMSMYQNVVPEYRSQIKELKIVTALLRNPMYKFRRESSLERLETLAENGDVSEAIDTIFIYYAQPNKFYCTDPAGCPKGEKAFTREQSQKAFYWARKMEGDKKTVALSQLLRDVRVTPVATEEDRIYLMFETEKDSRVALAASMALAFHHLDNRYFGNDMMDEAKLWLTRAQELDYNL